MKLIIQIPCFNEASTLPATIADLPREVPGFDTVEWLVINDGSSDETSEVARALGVHHVVEHVSNCGLARAFRTGLDACLQLGADVIVNTDADNQYCGADIPRLVAPVVAGNADIVIGDRGVDSIPEFSWVKRRLQRLGSWVVQRASKTNVPDATSGFRAFSRDAAYRMNVTNDFTYTLETIIQAGHRNLTIGSVPIGTNPKTRESRLFKTMSGYVFRSISTILRIYSMYQPFRVFAMVGVLFASIGLALGGRFVYYYATGDGDGKIQSLLLAVLMLVIGFQTLVTGLLSDLIGRNRRLLEETLTRVRRIDHRGAAAVSSSDAPNDRTLQRVA